MCKNVVLFLLLLLINSLAFGQSLDFAGAESPLTVLNRAFKSGRPLDLESIPSAEETFAKTKVLRILDGMVFFSTTSEQLTKSKAVYLVKMTKKFTNPAVPFRGPLFPGRPESTFFKEVIVFCGSECTSEKDFYDWHGSFGIDSEETEFRYGSSTRYVVRVLGDSVILKIKDGNIFGYGWYE